MLKVIVDGGCSHRPQFSRGVWGASKCLNFGPSESGSEAALSLLRLGGLHCHEYGDPGPHIHGRLL